MNFKIFICLFVTFLSVNCNEYISSTPTYIQKIEKRVEEIPEVETKNPRLVKKHIVDDYLPTPNSIFDFNNIKNRHFGSDEIAHVDLDEVMNFLSTLVNEKIRQNLLTKNTRQPIASPCLRGPINTSFENKNDILCFHRQYGVKLNRLLPKNPCPPKKIKFQVQSKKSPGKFTKTLQVDTSSHSKDVARNLIPTTTSATLQLLKEFYEKQKCKNQAKNVKKTFEKMIHF